jgi:hypothetical protein
MFTCLNQTLFNGPCDLGMRQDLRLCLGDATDLRVQASQARRKAPGRLQDSPLRWRIEGPPGEGPAIIFELRRVHRYHVPDEGSRRRLMQPLAAAVEDDVARLLREK